MKKTASPVMPFLALFLCFASAQTTAAYDRGTIKLISCAARQDSTQCEYTYTLSEGEDNTIYLQAGNFELLNDQGALESANSIQVAGGEWTALTDTVKVLNGVPIKISVRYALAPNKIRSIRAFNVLMPYPRPAVPVPQGNVTTPAPINLGGSNYTVTLSGCRAGENGTFTCAATFTPSK